MATSVVPLKPSSTLVNVAEHAELRLVRLLAESAPSQLINTNFEANCESCIANADAPGLIRTIIRDAGAVAALFGLESIEETVSAFSLLAALLDRVGSPNEEASLASEVAEAVGGNDAYDAGKRIAMLCSLYNLRSDGEEKCRLLAMIVKLAASSNPRMLAEGQILGDIIEADNISHMIQGWGVSKPQQRALFAAIADGLEQAGDSVRKQRLLLLLVESYTDPSEVNDKGFAAAKEASIGAIRDPVTLFTEQRSMLMMPAVVALGNNKATEPILSLLKIFQEGKLEDYHSFVSKNPSVINELGLSPDNCVRHMRLLSLCSLAAEHEEIPYSAIASTLQVDPNEVESWVIAAVSSGLLSAKMDQLQQVVMVERCVVRRFGMEQWKLLQSRLNTWKKNVRGVLDGLKRSQAIQQSQQ